MAAFSIAARLGTGFRTGRMAAAALAASAASGVAPLGVACQQCGVRTLSLAPTGFSSSSVPAVCDTLRLASPWTGRSADSSAGSTGVTSAMILKQQQQQIRLLSHQKLPPMATGRRPAGGATATSGSVGGQPAVPAGGESAATEIGAESNVASSVLAGEKHKQLVEAVFGLYGMMGGAAATAAGDDSSSSSDNSIAQLEATVSMLYAEDATFEDGLMCLKGRSEILKRYVLAAELCAEAVRVTYDPPVVLGATTVAPGPLEHLGQGLMKTNIQIEVQSTQEFVFRPPSERALAAEAFASKLPRPSKALMSAAVLRAWAARLPERVTLRVLTRLTLDGDGARVQSHQEEWLNRKLSKWPAGPHAVKRAIGRLVAKGTPMPD